MTSSAQCLDNRRLDLILFATEQCNFRCTYCWETPGHGKMSPLVVAGISRLLSLRAPGLTQLSIAWFGGEPLLARGVIREVMEQVRRLRENHSQLHVSSNMTTNAWHLDRAVLNELVALGVDQFQITIDGPQPWHDSRRLHASGGGTFSRIWNNLLALRETTEEWTVEIRLHIDQQNAGDIPQFLRQWAGEFAGDQRFRIFLRPLARLGGARDSELRTLSCERDHPIFDKLLDIAGGLGLEISTPKDIPAICHTVRAGSWIIRADGRVGKCPVALEHPANQLGRINPDGTLDIDNNRFLPWLRGLSSGDEKELGCPLDGIPGPPADETEAILRSNKFAKSLGERMSALGQNTVPSQGGH